MKRPWDDKRRATPATIKVTAAGRGFELRCERTGQWARASGRGAKLEGTLTSAIVQATLLRHRYGA